MSTLTSIILIALIIAIILFAYFTKLYLQRRKNLFVKKERVDKLTFNFIREYFQKEKVEDKNYVPVLIKMAQENPYNTEKETNVDFYTLSFFHKEKQTVLTEKTIILIAKSIDSNLSDALNGKDLLMFENL